jgi:hypothetical protein
VLRNLGDGGINIKNELDGSEFGSLTSVRLVDDDDDDDSFMGTKPQPIVVNEADTDRSIDIR